MLSALGLEIQAIKKAGGSTSIEVLGGVRVGTAEGSVLYAFVVTEQVYLRDESPIRVLVGKKEADGIIVSFAEGRLLVALESDLGPRIPRARLVSDDSFLLERLKEKLEEVRAGVVSFNREKADQSIGERPIRSAQAEVPKGLLAHGKVPPNEGQTEAIATALGSDVTYIWGPPGTGKTTVLARIVRGFYDQGLSVLIVSNTNIAVDMALVKVVELFEGEAESRRGVFLRHGPLSSPSPLEPYREQILLDDVVAHLGRELQERKDELQAKAADLEAKLGRLRRVMDELEGLEEAISLVRHLEGRFQDAKERHLAGERSVASLEERTSNLRADLARSSNMGSIRRLFSGLNPERISREIGVSESKLVAEKDALSALGGQIAETQAGLKQARDNVAHLTERTREYPPQAKCKKVYDHHAGRLAALRSQIAEVQKQLDALRDEIIANCRVLATTVYRTWLKGQVARAFDVVIADEASMLALPMIFYAAGLAARHVVIAGDFMQLPAIAVSREDDVDEWYKQDVFRKAGVAAAARAGEQTESLVMLKTQYRMRGGICDVINDLYYEGKLETARSVLTSPEAPFPFGGGPLLYVDTSPYNPWTALKQGTFSRYNLFHALLIRNIAWYLHEEGYLSTDEHGSNLGIVSPYAAQTRLLQGLLVERLGDDGGNLAATVHRFQGNERSAMVIDLTDSLGSRPSRFVKALDIEEDGARLLNVALSRARDHLVIVANFGFLREHTSRGSVVNRILDDFDRRGEPIGVEDLLPLGADEWIDGLESLTVPELEFDHAATGIFTEGTFYPAFRRDLMAANDSVVIFSPYATSAGTGRWMDTLTGLIRRDLQVRLVTRPPGNQGGVLEEGLDGLIQNMEASGVVVDLRQNMHEKLAIIDGRILWHGSLNIFSHRNTSESMLRIPSPSACGQIGIFVSPARGNEKAREADSPNLAKRENPSCPECSSRMVWKSGRYGIYFECETCGHKQNLGRSGRKPRANTKKRSSGRPGRGKRRAGVKAAKDCPDCGKPLVRRNGRYGEFLGCTGYPSCRHTEDVV